MNRIKGYRMLSGTLGIAFILFGGVLTFSFFGYQVPDTTPAIPTGPVGYYFVAFAGCALVGWGGGLLAEARRPSGQRTIAIMTALCLVLMSLVRMLAWVIGDYYAWLGELPRYEAGFFLLLALGFVWLMPSGEATT